MSALATLSAPITIRRSKVERPLATGHWVTRSNVDARLDRALSRPLTIVVAPAGHGKTTTIDTWLRMRQIDAAWMTVDWRDSVLTRFVAHLAVALDRVAPGILAPMYALLTAPDRLAPRDLGDAFGETLYDLERDVVLVLDDFHEAGDGPEADFIVGLLHAAPRRLHTILSSRRQPPFPLSRLRISGDVEELTVADLRFSARETGELLHLESGEDVDPEVAATVQASVGGWPAAIKLIAIGYGAGNGAIPRARQGERPDQLVLGYLGEEVLARLPSSHRHVLLCATLLDRFNAPLMSVLADVYGGGLLTGADFEQLRALELYREIPGLDEIWFSYHPVFREALRGELVRTADAAAIADVRRTAADWFARNDYVREAVTQLVAAGDMAAAAALIESRINEAFAREDWRSVASWLRSIPAAEVDQRPALLLASAWVAYLSGRDPRIADVLRTLRDPRYGAQATDEERAEIALLAGPDHDPSASIARAEHAIALMSPSKRYRHGYAHMILGLALAATGRDDEALAQLTAFTTRESSRIDAASIRGYLGRAFVLWHAGRLASCAQVAADLLQLAATNNLPISAGWGAVLLGATAHEQGDLAQAMIHTTAVIADAESLHYWCVHEAFCIQILAFLAQGRHDEADRALMRLRELAITSETALHLEEVDSLAARMALIRGDATGARRWLASAAPSVPHDGLKVIHSPYLTRIKVLIALGGPDMLIEADRLLAAYERLARETHSALARVEGRAIRALLHEARGEKAPATRALRESLALAAPEGIVQRYAYLGPALAPILRRLLAERVAGPFPRTVLDTLQTTLAAQPGVIATSEAPPRPDVASPLSEREIEVLRRLALRLTNKEIGEELFISPITVKNHIAHISDKLGVSGRRASVERASELGLLQANS